MQGGFALSGPLIRSQEPQSFFSAAYEHHRIRASTQSNFAVPTVAERSSGFGPTTSGEATFSLYPFPNNPAGPFGLNTFTQVLPADGDSGLFSLKLDRSFNAWRANHTATGRYSTTGEDSILPVTGGAIYSSLRPLVRTHNVATFFNSALPFHVTNTARFGWGKTSFDFREVRDPSLLPSRLYPDYPFLLNKPVLSRKLQPPGGRTDILQYFTTTDETESSTGPVGEVRLAGYATLGVDVFHFPQRRNDNTFQWADTVSYGRGRHTLAGGIELWHALLDSVIDRNARPRIDYYGPVSRGFWR